MHFNGSEAFILDRRGTQYKREMHVTWAWGPALVVVPRKQVPGTPLLTNLWTISRAWPRPTSIIHLEKGQQITNQDKSEWLLWQVNHSMDRNTLIRHTFTFHTTYPTSSLKRAARVGGALSVAVDGGAGGGGTSTLAPPQPATHISSRQVSNPPSLTSCNANTALSINNNKQNFLSLKHNFTMISRNKQLKWTKKPSIKKTNTFQWDDKNQRGTLYATITWYN